MHLTRLTLELRSAAARRDLVDVYDMHRTLSRGFVANNDAAPPRFLWRLEPTGSVRLPQVLIQSETQPDWCHLRELPGYLAKEPEAKAWLPEHFVGSATTRRFRLVANPTVTKNGKRNGLVTEDDQLAWLARQGDRLGFAVNMALVTDSEFVVSRTGKSAIQFQRACFEGILTIQDPSLVMAALRDGIGPAKAFGCGLLSLAPGS